MQRIDTKLRWEFKRVVNIKSDCVFPENIHTLPPLPTKGNGNSGGKGGGGVFQKQAISKIVGVASRVFFPRAPSKIDEQAVSFCTVNRSFRARVDESVDWVLFSRLAQ